MHVHRRTLLLLTLGLAATACGDRAAPAVSASTADPSPPAQAVQYVLPGEQVFPEGVAVDKSNGDLYVGSTQDGTIYRGNVERPGEAEVFLEPGTDGREAATGLKVDRQGRLFVAGRRTGRVFVYDTRSAELLAAYETPPGADSLVNDLTLTEDAAYFTDSFRPVIYRVSRSDDDVGELEPWLDLTDGPLRYEEGFNLNGISASDDGRFLLSVQYNTGRLWRIEVATQEIVEVDLDGQTLVNGDGLLLDGRTLLAVRNDPGVVVRIDLAADLASGVVAEEITDPSFRFPTTLAEYGGRLLVVNSQLNLEPGGAMGTTGDPLLPFTVSSIPLAG